MTNYTFDVINFNKKYNGLDEDINNNKNTNGSEYDDININKCTNELDDDDDDTHIYKKTKESVNDNDINIIKYCIDSIEDDIIINTKNNDPDYGNINIKKKTNDSDDEDINVIMYCND